MDVELSLTRIRCDNDGEHGDAEPYLWTAFFKLDGTVLRQRTDDPRFLAGRPELFFGQGSHGDLGPG